MIPSFLLSFSLSFSSVFTFVQFISTFSHSSIYTFYYVFVLNVILSILLSLLAWNFSLPISNFTLFLHLLFYLLVVLCLFLCPFRSLCLSLSLSLSLSASLLFVPNVDKTESTSLHEWLPTSFYWHQVNGNSGLDNPARSLRTFFTKNVELQANENPSSHQCDVIRPNTLPNIGLRLQCDQIGRFLKVMGDKFSNKRNVNML